MRPFWRATGWPAAAAGLAWAMLLLTLGSAAMGSWIVSSAGTLLVTLVAGAALYVLPGLALLRLLWRGEALALPEQLSLACGAGIALPPLCLQLAYLVGLPWTRTATALYVAAAALMLLWPPRVGRRQPARRSLRLSWEASLLAGLVLVALLVRLFMVRGLPVGMWGDSYHHTMIAQLLVENRGLFSSWEPYAPLTTFTYHFGFHANVAFFHLLSGVPVTRSLIVVGQLLSTATLALAYVLTVWLSRNRWAGIWAAALTGFVNTMPVYYVNWGRYTQLAGQVMLPAIMICWMAALERERLGWRPLLLAAILTAGLLLTHYLVALFAGVCIGGYLLLRVVRRPSWPVLRTTVPRTIAIGAVALLLALPWLLNTLSGYLVTRNAADFVGRGTGTGIVSGDSMLLAPAPFYLKHSVLLLAFAGLLLALARRSWHVVLAACWSAGWLLLIVPQVLGLPGTGIIKNFTAYIALYLPVIPLAGYALGAGQELFDRLRPRLGALLSTVALIACSIWGVRWQQFVINPANQLVLPADMEAMAWIRARTAPDADFLVEMFPAFNDSLVAGSDAGWWIPLLTGRRTTLPPITYGSERAADPDYARRINAFAAALREHPLPGEEGLRLIREAGIDYVFIGAHRAQEERIDVEALRRHPAFRVVYDQGGTTIFQILPGR